MKKLRLLLTVLLLLSLAGLSAAAMGEEDIKTLVTIV